MKAYLTLQLAGEPTEVFGVLFLDVQTRLICFEIMFRGTLTQTSVYPREVARAALAHEAATAPGWVIYRDVLARFFQHTKTGPGSAQTPTQPLTTNESEFKNGYAYFTNCQTV